MNPSLCLLHSHKTLFIFLSLLPPPQYIFCIVNKTYYYLPIRNTHLVFDMEIVISLVLDYQLSLQNSTTSCLQYLAINILKPGAYFSDIVQ